MKIENEPHSHCRERSSIRAIAAIALILLSTVACASPVEARVKWAHTDIAGIHPIGAIGVFDRTPRTSADSLLLHVAFVEGASVEFRRQLYDAWIPRAGWNSYLDGSVLTDSARIILFPIPFAINAIANLFLYGQYGSANVQYRYGFVGWCQAFIIPSLTADSVSFDSCWCLSYPSRLVAISRDGAPLLSGPIDDWALATYGTSVDLNFKPPQGGTIELTASTYVPIISEILPKSGEPASITNVLPFDPTQSPLRIGVELQSYGKPKNARRTRSGFAAGVSAVDHFRTEPQFPVPRKKGASNEAESVPEPIISSSARVLLPFGKDGEPLECLPGSVKVSGAGIRREFTISGKGTETVTVPLIPFIIAHLEGTNARQDLVLTVDVGYSFDLTIAYNEWVRILLDHWIEEGL